MRLVVVIPCKCYGWAESTTTAAILHVSLSQQELPFIFVIWYFTFSLSLPTLLLLWSLYLWKVSSLHSVMHYVPWGTYGCWDAIPKNAFTAFSEIPLRLSFFTLTASLPNTLWLDRHFLCCLSTCSLLILLLSLCPFLVKCLAAYGVDANGEKGYCYCDNIYLGWCNYYDSCFAFSLLN